MPKLPLAEAASPVLPYLFLGPRSSASTAFIKSKSITHVLSIGSTPASPNEPITYCRISLSDDPSSSMEQASTDADEFIKSAKSGRILVHCSAAISRSPTIIAAYLMKKHNMTLKDALGLVVRTRPAACPNPGFMQQLIDWEKTLFGSNTITDITLPSQKKARLALFS